MQRATLVRRAFVGVFLTLAGCQTVTSVSGTWTGAMDSPNKLRVRFVLEDQGGKLSGLTYWHDPKTGAFELEGGLSGARTDGSASWTTDGDLTIDGKFEGDTFKGTIHFPAHEDVLPAWSAQLTLSR